MVRVLGQADVKAKLLNLGHEAVVSTPDAATVMIEADMTRMGKAIKDANIKPE